MTTSPTEATSSAAASMVLGILSVLLGWIFCILPTLAIIFASTEYKQASEERRKPSSMAVAGLTLGIVSAVLYAILLLTAWMNA